MNFKLGKQPARHDPRTLRLADYFVAAALPSPPPGHDWTAGMPDDFGMLANDQIGDCAAAMALHEIEVEEYATGMRLLPFTPEDAISLYSAVTGYSPDDASSDRGTSLLDLLNYECHPGFRGHCIDAYAGVMLPGDEPTADHIKLACWLFGPLSSGVVLHDCDVANAGDWDVAPGDSDSPIAGGHAIPIVGYGARGITAITWGRRKRATWAWLLNRIDECYARLGVDFYHVGAIQIAPNGLNRDQLRADLALIAADGVK